MLSLCQHEHFSLNFAWLNLPPPPIQLGRRRFIPFFIQISPISFPSFFIFPVSLYFFPPAAMPPLHDILFCIIYTPVVCTLSVKCDIVQQLFLVAKHNHCRTLKKICFFKSYNFIIFILFITI